MKRLIWVLAVMIGSSTYAQQATKMEQKETEETTVAKYKLRSPEFKNYKPWQHKKADAKTVAVQTKSAKRNLRSPEYKNYKPWEHKDNTTESVAVQTTNTKRKLRSPEYKNYKPWRD